MPIRYACGMMIDFATLSYAEDLRELAGMRSIADAGMAVGGGYAFIGPAGTWMCVAKGVGVGGRVVTRADMQQLVEIYRSRGLEPRIDVCCYADPSVHKGLAELGFGVVESEFLLVRSLNLPPGSMPGQEFAPEAALELKPADGICLEVVNQDDEQQVIEVASVIATGFSSDATGVSPADVELTARPIRQRQTVTVAARIEGQLVGAGMMDVVEVEGEFAGLGSRASLCGLFALSVLPGFRKRGVQLAIMRERLRQARERGALFAAIGSAPTSPTLRNARRLGFSIIGGKTTLTRPEAGLIGRPREGPLS
jgi:predicted N-acetyltransferase YhbS